MSRRDGAVAAVSEAVTSWEGVTSHPHRFGGVEFRLGKRELGHLHANPGGVPIADLPFPKAVSGELIAEGRARPHHWLPDSGWVTAPMGSAEQVATAIALFRMGYDRAVAARERRAGAGAAGTTG